MQDDEEAWLLARERGILALTHRHNLVREREQDEEHLYGSAYAVGTPHKRHGRLMDGLEFD